MEISDSDEDCPELVPLAPSKSAKIPVTIITGFLGQCGLSLPARPHRLGGEASYKPGDS